MITIRDVLELTHISRQTAKQSVSDLVRNACAILQCSHNFTCKNVK